MKEFIFFARVLTFLIFAHSLAIAQGQDLEPLPNYVVIGAFSHQKNAVHFTDDANKNSFPAKFEMNVNRNLYYVYVMNTPDREYALAEALKLRTDTKYFDTWVYSGRFDRLELLSERSLNQDIDPATGQTMQRLQSGFSSPQKADAENSLTASVGVDPVSGEKRQSLNSSLTENTSKKAGRKTAAQSNKESQANLAANEGTEQNTLSAIDRNSVQSGVNGPQRADSENLLATDNASVDPVTGQRPESTKAVQRGQSSTTASDSARIANIYVPKKVNTAPLVAEEIVGRNFFFQVFRADNHQVVEGEVDVIDFEKARRMATYQANNSVKVIMPSGASKKISFVCQVFGYRKQQVEFDPSNPAAEFYLDERGNLVVPFELVRLQKGDIAIMYNVFFFKDAAVMRPESRYEVNNLLELLVENPTYHIKIHGHTNGNAPGKIIRLDNSKNFYSLASTKQGSGSAKKLSEERALVIREFLISSGIPPERMQVEAWGGKKPIHDKNSARAHENVRVEIEILSQ